MTLPTFLGIGAQRAGTTWLDKLLASHLEVYLPTRRKEVHFFDWYYERGLQWYEKFFPSNTEAAQYKAIGEITPNYLICPHCPERIAGVPSITRLVLIARNPIDRAYSNYGHHIRMENYSGSFEDFLNSQPYVLERGFYYQKLRGYLRYFEREQILVLIHEHAVADVPKTRDTLARFLGIEVNRFPPTAGTKRVSAGYIPRARFASALAFRVAYHLRKWDLDRIVNLAKGLGVKRLFGETGSLPPMKEETRKYLREIYEDDIRELELFLQMDLEWR